MKIILFLLFTMPAVFNPVSLAAQIIYVDADALGNNNGTGWEDAYTDLQDALAAASFGNEIWVAKGVYKPVTPDDLSNVTEEERETVFQLVNAVPVYGGFSGSETARDQRNWQENLTILSGDIDDNDNTTPDGITFFADDVQGTNSYRIVLAENVNHNTILDGFYITGAHSNNEGDPNIMGGGMRIVDSNPTLSNLLFTGNSSFHGGGMHLSNSSPVLTNVSFGNNWADLFGGGMVSINNGKPELNSVLFQSNAVGANGTGGGMSVNFSDAILNDVTFLNNSAVASGGGFRTSSSSPVLTNVTFSGNSAGSGGGLYTEDSAPVITGAMFDGNSATHFGGGLHSLRSNFTLSEAVFEDNTADNRGGGVSITAGRLRIATLQNIFFTGNSAENDGAAIRVIASSPVLSNLIFYDNVAGGLGGGIHFSSLGDDNDPVLYNLVFYNNEAGFGGGAVANIGNSSTEFFNSIFWGNSSPAGNEIWNSTNSTAALYFCILSFDTGDIVSGDGFSVIHSHITNPQFVNPEKGNFRVQPGSPAINNGDPETGLSLFPVDDLENPIDFDRQPRFQNHAIDIGAFESDTRSIQLTGMEGFRMLTSPVETTIADLLSTVWTQGMVSANYEGGGPNIWLWDNSAEGANEDNWIPATDLNTTMQAGDGILVYVFDLDEFGNPESAGFPKTLSVNGADHPLPFSPTINPNPGGFTMIGNPSVSSIAWEDVTKNDLDDIIYVWDPNDEEWKTSDGSIGELEDGIIRPFQSFFTRTSDGGVNPSLEISKTTIPGQFYGKQSSEQPFSMHLRIEGKGLHGSAWLRFSNRGSTKRHAGDGLKLWPLSEDFALLSFLADDGTPLDIKHLPLQLNEPLRVPLTIETTRSGRYTLSAGDINLPHGWTAFLQDETMGNTMKVIENLEYPFDKKAVSYKTANGIYPGSLFYEMGDHSWKINPLVHTTRFSLLIYSDETVLADLDPELPNDFKLHQNYPNPFNPSTTIKYEIPSGSNVHLDLFDITGRHAANLVNEYAAPGRYQIQFDGSGLSSGLYIYRLHAGNKAISRKLTLIK